MLYVIVVNIAEQGLKSEIPVKKIAAIAADLPRPLMDAHAV